MGHSCHILWQKHSRYSSYRLQLTHWLKKNCKGFPLMSRSCHIGSQKNTRAVAATLAVTYFARISLLVVFLLCCLSHWIPLQAVAGTLTDMIFELGCPFLMQLRIIYIFYSSFLMRVTFYFSYVILLHSLQKVCTIQCFYKIQDVTVLILCP